MIPAGATGTVEFLDRGAEPVESLIRVEGPGHEPDALQQLLPHLLAEPGAGVFLDRVVDHPGEILVIPITAGEAHEAEASWQQTTICQVVDSRHQLLAGKIASHTEDH